MSDTGIIPQRGLAKGSILRRMGELRQGDADWRAGRTWSLVYHLDDAHLALLKEAYGEYFSENLLNPVAFQGLAKMEAEVVRMTAGMLNGDDQTVGTMTSGGTESLLLAVKAYRDRARRCQPWIRRPQLVAPATIHVAVAKACHYFDVELIRVPVGDDYRADVAGMRRRVGRNTIALAASAPQYPHGVVDPIGAIGQLALERGLPLHVDSCIGGFLLPWLERLGRPVPAFDFRVPGVTSISADVHKYGYAAKGASVIVYRSMDYLRHQFFVATDWAGGLYASPTIAGTRGGGSIAAAWAAMQAIGQDGYLELARRTLETTERYLAGVGTIPELCVIGAPDMSLVAVGSRTPEIDIYAVADRLESRGWCVDRQQHPASIHVTVTPNHAPIVAGYIADLAAAVAEVKADPDLATRGKAATYGMIAGVPFDTLVQRSARRFMEGMYAPGGSVPDLGALGNGRAGDAQGPEFGPLERLGVAALRLRHRFGRWLRRRS